MEPHYIWLPGHHRSTKKKLVCSSVFISLFANGWLIGSYNIRNNHFKNQMSCSLVRNKNEHYLPSPFSLWNSAEEQINWLSDCLMFMRLFSVMAWLLFRLDKKFSMLFSGHQHEELSFTRRFQNEYFWSKWNMTRNYELRSDEYG